MSLQDKMQRVMNMSNGVKARITEKTGIVNSTLYKIFREEYCSNSSIKKLDEAYPKVGFSEHYKKSECVICGKEFISNSKKNKKCSECTEKTVKNKIGSGLIEPDVSIFQFQDEAKVKGLTYGQLQAEKRMANV